MASMDEIDNIIIKELNRNSRLTMSEISKQVKLSIPAVSKRIQKLNQSGIIESYTVKINREKFNYKLVAYMAVQIDNTESIKNFDKMMIQTPSVLECHQIAGLYNFLIKVVVEDMNALNDFLKNSLLPLKGIVSFKTIIVLSTLKEKINRC